MISQDNYVFVPLLGRISFGKEVVAKSIKHVNVINPFLVATPSTAGVLVHPIFTAEFGSQTHDQLTKNRKRINTIALIYLFAIPIFMLALGLKNFASIFFIALSSIYISGKYELSHIYNDQQKLKAKVKYYTQSLHASKKQVFSLGGIFFVFGIIQLILAHQAGGDGALTKYGLVINTAFDGQYYRFLTAQFIHANFMHWALNLLVFIWFARLCYPVTQGYTALCAVVIAVLSNFLIAGIGQFVVLPYDGIVGFSGGITGLTGILFGASVANHPALPKGLYISLLPIVFITFFCFSFYTTTSTLLHFLGALVGFTWGLLIATNHRTR